MTFNLSRRMTLVGCLLLILARGTAMAQQTYPTTAPTRESGFEPIFDGRSLAGWDGDPRFWRVEGDALVGEITPGNEIKRNTFIIWRGAGGGAGGDGGAAAGVTKDFELKLRYRISAKGNSGINYRSVEMDDAKFALRGYQFDIDGAAKYSGNNYEERGRTFMAVRGQVVRAVEGGQRHVIGSTGDFKELAKTIREDDWNDVHIIARGSTIVHLLNGRVMSVLIDDDPAHRAAEGKLGVQVHVGPPMKVEYRDIRLKKL
jgi:hypothetical protein